MTFPLFQRIFSEFPEGANPIAPVIKFANDSRVRGLRMGGRMEGTGGPRRVLHSPRRRLRFLGHILLATNEAINCLNRAWNPEEHPFSQRRFHCIMRIIADGERPKAATTASVSLSAPPAEALSTGARSWTTIVRIADHHQPSTWRDLGPLELCLTQRGSQQIGKSFSLNKVSC